LEKLHYSEEGEFLKRLCRSRRGASTAISTVILTGTIVALVSVATVFVNNVLWTRVAESDFNSAKQFMQTIGLQVDDVAWIVGRKTTVRYSSRDGSVVFLPSALNYTVYVKTQGGSTYDYFASYQVGILLFNVPVTKYSVYDGYYELIYPPTAVNLTFTGSNAPVARVFGVEKLTPSMGDGRYTRVVVTPSVRSLFSEIIGDDESTYYVKLYLPVLVQGSGSGVSQSVTLTGSSVTTQTKIRVASVRVTVGFPSATFAQGFDSTFFHFPSLSQQIDVPQGYDNSILEFYSGRVNVELGVHA
jgi:hypothetical protein